MHVTVHIAHMMHKKRNFKKLREERGLSRSQAAQLAEMDVSTICRWEINGVPKHGAAKFVIQQIEQLPKISTKEKSVAA